MRRMHSERRHASSDESDLVLKKVCIGLFFGGTVLLLGVCAYQIAEANGVSLTKGVVRLVVYILSGVFLSIATVAGSYYLGHVLLLSYRSAQQWLDRDSAD